MYMCHYYYNITTLNGVISYQALPVLCPIFGMHHKSITEHYQALISVPEGYIELW